MTTTIEATNLKELITKLTERKQKLESSRSIQDIVNETFNRQWGIIEKEKREAFLEKVKLSQSVLQLEIAIIESIRGFLDPDVVEIISLGLQKGRYNNNLRHMNSVYFKYKENIKIRQVLKLVIAVYRYNRNLLDDKKDPSFYVSVSSLKSQIKYATICTQCGEIAKQILINMTETKAVQLP